MSSLADRLSATMSSRQAPQSSTPFEQVDRRIVQLAPELVKFAAICTLIRSLAALSLLRPRLSPNGLVPLGFRMNRDRTGAGSSLPYPSHLRQRLPLLRSARTLMRCPSLEENEVPYRSRNAGVMHACGHDAHSAILLGTLLALKSAGPISVGWRGIFQPSEESGHGAREMVKRGALSGVDAIVALHVDPTIASGKLALTAGPQTAFCQDFEIEVRAAADTGRVRITRLIQSPSRRTLSPLSIRPFPERRMPVIPWL